MDFQIQAVYDTWLPLAEKWATEYGSITPFEILACITEESNGNPDAVNWNDPSYGLMSVELWLGKAYAGVADRIQLMDPDVNIKAGAGYLNYLKHRYAKDYPLGSTQGGWIQMNNLGETKFLKGERVPGYESAFQTHLAALQALAEKAQG